jgi:hypothetical protein
MEKVLVTTDEFNGRYVAMKSFEDNTIVGVGDDPEKALKDAEAKGIKNPVLLYIPQRCNTVPKQTRRGHWRSLVAEPSGCKAPRYANFAGLHSW